MNTSYEKLRSIVDEVDSLKEKHVKWKSPEMQAWHNKAMRWLLNQFGDDSYEYKNFSRISFESILIDERSAIEACAKGLAQAKAILTNYFDEIDIGSEKEDISCDYSKVFIVHGHDGELKQSVARVIEKQGIEVIILTEQANQGKTIIEKFENYSDVGGAVCLFTADDICRNQEDGSEKPRARQNVVFETGYFIGALGRDHIVILADHGVEMPSDLSGVVHTDTANWQVDLLRELKAMGYAIDFNKLF